MEWLPPERALVMQAAVAVAVVAFQPVTATPFEPPQAEMGVPLSVNSTEPPLPRATVAPAGAWTVAVKVTEASTLEAPPSEEVSDEIEVLALATVTGRVV